jgi:hypothetical protein
VKLGRPRESEAEAERGECKRNVGKKVKATREGAAGVTVLATKTEDLPALVCQEARAAGSTGDLRFGLGIPASAYTISG